MKSGSGHEQNLYFMVNVRVLSVAYVVVFVCKQLTISSEESNYEERTHAVYKEICKPKEDINRIEFFLFSFVFLLFHPVSAGVFLFHLIVQCFWVTLCVDRKTRSEKPDLHFVAEIVFVRHKLYALGSKLPLFPYNRGWSSTQS